MDFRRLLAFLAVAWLLGAYPLFPIAAAEAQEQSQWEEQAEETFRLIPGMGPQLMTQEEWREHREKMQSMTPEERERYRQEWHKKMMQRARERGIGLPEIPGPRGPGAPGRGMGPGDGTRSRGSYGGGMGRSDRR